MLHYLCQNFKWCNIVTLSFSFCNEQRVENQVQKLKDVMNLLVSHVLAFPVYIWKKSWYSFVSDTCIFEDEYMFIVEKNETSSSKRPKERPPEFARMSPNLSHVQFGRNIGLEISTLASKIWSSKVQTNVRFFW